MRQWRKAINASTVELGSDRIVHASLGTSDGAHEDLQVGGGMERLRSAEKSAKERRAFLYASTPSTSNSRSVGGGSGLTSSANGNVRNFEALVVRVWSGDQVSVVPKNGGKERRIQLSSTRAPKYVVVSLHLSYRMNGE